MRVPQNQWAGFLIHIKGAFEKISALPNPEQFRAFYITLSSCVPENERSQKAIEDSFKLIESIIKGGDIIVESRFEWIPPLLECTPPQDRTKVIEYLSEDPFVFRNQPYQHLTQTDPAFMQRSRDYLSAKLDTDEANNFAKKIIDQSVILLIGPFDDLLMKARIVMLPPRLGNR